MTKSSFSLKPDEFSSAPILCLLPSVGDSNKLASFSSSMFARFEKLNQVVKELSHDRSSVVLERFIDERDMLKEVLDWLKGSSAEE